MYLLVVVFGLNNGLECLIVVCGLFFIVIFIVVFVFFYIKDLN